MDLRKIIPCFFAYFICGVASDDVINYSWCIADSQQTFLACMQQKDKLTKTSPVIAATTADEMKALFMGVGSANPHNLDVMLPMETNDETLLSAIKGLYSSTPYAQSKLVVLTGEVFQLRTSDPAALISADVFDTFAGVFPDQTGINTDPKVFWAFTLSKEKGVLGFTTENINQIKAARGATKIKNLGIVIDAAIASHSNMVELVPVLSMFKYLILESRENEVECDIPGLVGLYGTVFLLGQTDIKLVLNPELFLKVLDLINSFTTTTKENKEENHGNQSWKINLNLIILCIVFGFFFSK